MNYKAQDKMLEAIFMFLEGGLNSLPFNYCEQGSVVKVNLDGTYNVRIDDDIYENMKTINANTYEVNNVVWIEKINGKSDYKYIKCKV